jgi:raffinose/stachyose/melibiose transport system substrate-binding protein
MSNLEISRRRALQLGGGAALLTFLAACSASGSTAAGQLQYWSGFNSKDAENWFKKNVVEAFNQTDPAVPVALSVKQFDTMDRLVQTALAAGSGPDVLLASGPAQLRSYVDSGYALPLDDYATELGWQDRILPWALQTGIVDGKLYALPTSYESLLTFYNPATLADNGWTYPTTRAEFEAICEEAMAKGIMPVAAGNADYQAANEWHVSIILNHAAGPEVVRQALTGEIPFSDPVFVDAIAQLKGYFDKGWYGGSPEAYFTNSFSTGYQDLAAGKAVFDFSGTWGIGEITPFFGAEGGNDAEWQWGAIPSLRDGVSDGIWELSLGGTCSVNAKSQNPDLAADLIDFLMSDPKRQGQGLAEVGYALAPIEVSADDFPADTDPRVTTLYEAISNATEVGYTTWTFFPPKTDTFIVQGWEKVITGETSPVDFCTQMNAIFAGELAAGAVPALPEA